MISRGRLSAEAQPLMVSPCPCGSVFNTAIELASDAAFTCGRCNRCCQGDWIIGITAAEADRLRALYPAIEPVHGTELVRGNALFNMARTESGACVFLDEDGCRVHKEHGEYAKPAICRRFPYSFRRAHGAAWLHLSRMCPTVYAGRGAGGEELARVAAATPGVDSAVQVHDQPVKLAGTVEIPWDVYQHFETLLVNLLRDERWPLDDALAAGLLMLRRLADDPASWGRGDDQDRMDLVLRAIADRQPLLGLHRYVLATVVTVIESRRGGKVFSGYWAQDLARYTRLLMRRGRDRFKSLKDSVDLVRIDLVPWPRREVPSLVPCRSYLASHIHGKFLLTAPDVEYGYHLLLGAYATAKFYARASAVAAGRASLHADDLQAGIETVESNLLLHPQHLPSMQQRLVRGWFSRFLFHPAYPSTMTNL